MKGRIPIVIAAVLVALTLALVATAPARLENKALSAKFEGDLTDWLAESESLANAREALIPGTEKRIRWYQEQQKQ